MPRISVPALGVLIFSIATTAFGCIRVGYQPRPASLLQLESFDALNNGSIRIRMSAGGKAVLQLPIAHKTASWSVMPEPLEAVAVHTSQTRKGKSVVSTHVFDYGMLNPYEVSALAGIPGFDIAATRWQGRQERLIPLRLTYYRGSKAMREISGELVVDRGEEVALAPEPIVVNVTPGEKTNSTLSLGREFIVRMAAKNAPVWRLAATEATMAGSEIRPMDMRSLGVVDGALEYKGIADGSAVRLMFVSGAAANDGGGTFQVTLPVLPVPKC